MNFGNVVFKCLNKGIPAPITFRIILALVVLVAGFSFWQCSETQKEGVIFGSDPLNCTYAIDNEPITLKNGYAEQEILPGSATKIRKPHFSYI
jgi:hypothetical protein